MRRSEGKSGNEVAKWCNYVEEGRDKRSRGRALRKPWVHEDWNNFNE